MSNSENDQYRRIAELYIDEGKPDVDFSTPEAVADDENYTAVVIGYIERCRGALRWIEIPEFNADDDLREEMEHFKRMLAQIMAGNIQLFRKDKPKIVAPEDLSDAEMITALQEAIPIYVDEMSIYLRSLDTES